MRGGTSRHHGHALRAGGSDGTAEFTCVLVADWLFLAMLLAMRLLQRWPSSEYITPDADTTFARIINYPMRVARRDRELLHSSSFSSPSSFLLTRPSRSRNAAHLRPAIVALPPDRLTVVMSNAAQRFARLIPSAVSLSGTRSARSRRWNFAASAVVHAVLMVPKTAAKPTERLGADRLPVRPESVLASHRGGR